MAALESVFCKISQDGCRNTCRSEAIDSSLLEALVDLKQVAGQINVAIHAVGILLALPTILRPGEQIESLSLGAGNTGREFDLVTSRRVAEFKFIQWRGGAESIRQNSLFKDFYGLAEADTAKRRYLYVLGLAHPLHFLKGGRSLDSVMSRNAALFRNFRRKYARRFTTIGQYFAFRRKSVQIVDLLPSVPALARLAVDTSSSA